MKHPIQPIERDSHGTKRFKENKIVSHLLNVASAHGCDLNAIACMDFTKDDRMQLAQLIGYGLGGFSELSYVDDDTYRAAALMAKGMTEDKAKIAVLENEIKVLRESMVEPMARLFGLHPDDLRSRNSVE